jgi:FtsZ-interacting cell division protein ZipA
MLSEKTKNDLDGSLIWLSHSNIEEDAKELNQFCALVDHMMTLTLIPKNNGLFDNEKLIETLKIDGFKVNKDGYHEFKGRDKHPLFRVTSLNQQPLSFNLDPYIQGILFQMDLPLTLSCKESFDAMLESITNFQKELECMLVDSNKKELNVNHIERIRYQVEKIENQMVAKNIIPGSSCARRLFS